MQGSAPSRPATAEEEAWLDAQEFLDHAHTQWLYASDGIATAAQDAHGFEDYGFENSEAFGMMRDVQQASEFLVNREIATKASFHRLSSMRKSALKLVSIIDEAIHTVVQNERNAALEKIEAVMQMKNECEEVAIAERMQLQSEVALLKQQGECLVDLLEQEKDKSICAICFTRPRNVITLPCLHFHYCNSCLDQHQRTNRTCPSCRCPISGTLKCSL
ncbi:uncharacterized protein LOC9654177 isoform X1 [Selaginella moellendorffii]|uniref:uncharacterized protein LOC9654177 isoform X1 n=1 Tax=Selaginella moellendorffii TaxID=88036 RepID=UPI000D1C7FC6|nr:uncharacterized protein LOC9654177 isoform X1 [Selaginella moellendorffii]|eukprot:XP_024543919.1 uncharacterized protein LOC9654177 isoform X1 [Selaginella moellendorffii]